MERKTNFLMSKQAFEEWFLTYMSEKNHSERMSELALIVENNDGDFYNNFISSKRIKSHNAAFYSVILAVSPFLEKGYYISNEHVKKLILEFFKMDYKDFLKDLVIYLEESREQFLRENK